MSTLASSHTIALLVSSAGVERRPHDPARRRAAVHAALRAYASRLRRRYGPPAPRAERTAAALGNSQLHVPSAHEWVARQLAGGL